MPKSKLTDHYRHKIETELSTDEYDQFFSLCNQRKTSKSALAREAIVSYLNHIEETRETKAHREAAQCIRNTTDRICAMLAKQGMQMGTLLELARQNLQEAGSESQFNDAAEYSRESFLKTLEKRLSKPE